MKSKKVIKGTVITTGLSISMELIIKILLSLTQLSDALNNILSLISKILLPVLLISLIYLFIIIYTKFTTEKKPANLPLILNSDGDNSEQIENQPQHDDIGGNDEIDRNIVGLLKINQEEISHQRSVCNFHELLSMLVACLLSIIGIILYFKAANSGIEIKNMPLELYIAGTALIMFSVIILVVAMNSCNHRQDYYRDLHQRERFLLALRMTKQLPKEDRKTVIVDIIKTTLSDLANLYKQ